MVDLARRSVLVVDDEPLVLQFVIDLLRSAGYEPIGAEDALAAAELLGSERPELVLLDVNMPGVDGLSLLQRIRRSSDVPVILLTGRGDEQDRIDGLRSGADDYIVKPFSVGELLARVESVLRRSRPGRVATEPTELRFDALTIDPLTREVRLGEVAVDLTSKEFDLLVFLARSPRQVFSREQLLEQVWNSSSAWQDSATVTEHVRRVRRKIEPDPDNPRWLQTVRGVGYRFQP
jgi:DNA-binding response OmpR family regulator